MFKTWYYKAFEKIEIHWYADGIERLNGVNAFNEINGTKQMYCYDFLTDWINGTDGNNWFDKEFP